MKILLVTTSQFGYLVDYHRYYDYLKAQQHEVKYLCYDHGRVKVDEGNPDILYVSKQGSKIAQLRRFISAIKNAETTHSFDRILVNYFLFVSTLTGLISREKMILDIRTVSIHTKAYKRRLFDGLIRFAASRFERVTILNETSAQHLGIKKYTLLPLGGAKFNHVAADPSYRQKYAHLFNTGYFTLLYVGTLHKRRIIECVRGFHEFLTKHPRVKARLIIIGQGFGNEVDEIRSYAEEHGLQDAVFAPGFIPQSGLPVFFEHADCGVCYVPLTPYFNVQPSTKTYEYLINGIPVIATTIKDNVRLIAGSNVPCGVLIGDSAPEFEAAVEKMIGTQFNSTDISAEFSKYEWNNLFNKYLHELFL